MQPFHQLERDHGADHDAERGAQVHHDQFRAQPQDALDVHGQGEQHQGGGQQDVARDRVIEMGVLAVDQADGVVHTGNQVAQQQRRHVRIEALPQPLLARGGPEHGAEGGGDQAEDDDVVLDQGGCFHGDGVPGSCRPRAGNLMNTESAVQMPASGRHYG